MTSKLRPEPVVHTSLGLSALCQRLEGSCAWNILELGRALGENVEFWSRYSEYIYVADLSSGMPLPEPDPSEESESPGPDWAGLLPLPEESRFNVILAWDLLNYIQLSTVAGLADYLDRFCRPAAVIFASIFDLRQMPEEITSYRIVDESRLSYECGSAGMRPCPRHQPRALTAVMRQFQVANSFRLRNGVVEYLFVHQ
jgi:hypothetical protein